MAFIGESRRTSASPWGSYICLRKDECRALLPLFEKAAKKANERLEYYEGLYEAGEMTTRQQTALDHWENQVGILESIISNIKAF